MYAPSGEDVSERPTVIYLDPGAPRMTTRGDAFDPTDRVATRLIPHLLRDERTGANIPGRGATEIETYRIVKIGTQFWFADNLRTTRWSDGTPIPTGMDNAAWGPLDGWGAGCAIAHAIPFGEPGAGTISSWIDANSIEAAAVATRNRYGLLYNFHAITRTTASSTSESLAGQITDEISPDGWGVPTVNQLRLLFNYVYQSVAPTTGIVGLKAPFSASGTNESGFGANGNANRTGAGAFATATYYFVIDTYLFSGNLSTRARHQVNIPIFRTHASAENIQWMLRDAAAGHYIRLVRD